MQDLILYIVKNLVSNPEAVSVNEQRNGGEVNLLLTVDPADMGMVIGKSGNTIKSIRKLLIVKAMAENVRVNLQLAEPEGGRIEKPEQPEESEQATGIETTKEPQQPDKTPGETSEQS